jgi:class 3 adenylate cyclase/tetratricopeptide (TPR) repeat protein
LRPSDSGWHPAGAYTPPMTACPSCGAANPDQARFCSECGAALVVSAIGGEARKVVTVLFCDVVGSTELGERVDAETVRATMSRYFDLARHAIESHGGTVEKFIGDAVMAVFGIPQLHEDDPLRAIRAALAIQSGLQTEGGDGQARGLRARIGISTGEVVVGRPGGETMATGDAVNTAARIEQAAAAGTVLIGELTERLARQQVMTTAIDAIDAKGKAEAVRVFRVDGLVDDPTAIREPAPLVGRDAELAVVTDAVQRSAASRSIELVTIVAHAGVGKSRLIEAAIAHLPTRTRVLRARCLPYGDGIASWPIREVFRAAAGITDRDTATDVVSKLAALAEPDASASMIAAGTAQMMGVGGIGVGQDDGFWAVRRMLERLAEDAPLVVVFEDLHWADPMFLDLLEYALDLSAGTPIALVATARPELLESRPAWGAGRSNAQVVRLEALRDDAATRLCRSLEGGSGLTDGVVARIVEAAEGNPLFVEEMVASLRDEGILRRDETAWTMPDVEITVPPTVKALLAARLDRLPEPTRVVIERGSVIGRIFETLALAEIAPKPLRASLTGHLITLVRREFIRPARPDLGSGDAYAFRHVLIRDAAYDALPKRDRAHLHERIADRIETVSGDELSQYQEVVAHHLEQAYRYRLTLGESDARTQALADRASAHLTAIADRSFEAGALDRAGSTYRRAIEMAGSAPPAMLLLNAGDVMARNADPDGLTVLAAAVAAARAEGDEALVAMASSVEAMHAVGTRRLSVNEAVARIEDAIRTFEPDADPAALARAKGALFFCLWGTGRLGDTDRIAAETVEHWRATGRPARVARAIAIATGTLVDGPAPVPEAIARCEGWMQEVSESPNARRVIVESLAMLAMLDGRFEDARRQLQEARTASEELGQSFDGLAMLVESAEIEGMAGNLDEAESILTGVPARLEQIQSFLTLPAAALLSRYRTLRGDPTSGLATLPPEPAEDEDIFGRTTWYRAAALAHLGLGQLDEAQRYVSTAIDALADTDLITHRADAFEILGDILGARGDLDAARESLGTAIRLYEQKQAVAPLTLARRHLELLEARERANG